MEKKVEEVKESTTTVKTCTCKHSYQDQIYGIGKRVHNKCGINGKVAFRCTVCGITK